MASATHCFGDEGLQSVDVCSMGFNLIANDERLLLYLKTCMLSAFAGAFRLLAF